MQKLSGKRISWLGAVTLGGIAVAVAFAPAQGSAQAAKGDAVRGKAIYARCAACHSVKPGEKRMGPSLAGVVGRQAGAVPGVKYSAAMIASKNKWTRKNLDEFLKAPRKAVPGTSMLAPGVTNDVDRNNLIAYLEALPAR